VGWKSLLPEVHPPPIKKKGFWHQQPIKSSVIVISPGQPFPNISMTCSVNCSVLRLKCEASEITPWLYIGNQQDAKNALLSTERMFDMILSVMDAPLDEPRRRKVYVNGKEVKELLENYDGKEEDEVVKKEKVVQRFISLVDAKKAASDGTLDSALEIGWEILSEFADKYDVSEMYGEYGVRVLVHCRAGMSRSVTTAAMFLIRRFGLTAHQAMRAIKLKRPVAKPNNAFLEKLDCIEQELRKTRPLSYPLLINFCQDSSHFIARKIKTSMYQMASIVELDEQMSIDESFTESGCPLNLSTFIEELVLCNCPLGSSNSAVFINAQGFSWAMEFLIASIPLCHPGVSVFLLDIIRMLSLDVSHLELLSSYLSTKNHSGFTQWLLNLVPGDALSEHMGLKIGIVRIIANFCSHKSNKKVQVFHNDIITNIGLLIPVIKDVILNGNKVKTEIRSDSDIRFALEGIEAVAGILEFMSGKLS
jgi:protein-tyrosine phosphatase